MQNTVAKKESVKGRLTRSDNFCINASSSLAFGHSCPHPHTPVQNAETIDTAPPFRSAFEKRWRLLGHADVANAVVFWTIEQNALIHSTIFATLRFVSRIG
jgi:hypothetical protein